MPEPRSDQLRAPGQTPAQWAVRLHGVALAILLAASVPVVHLLWHAVAGHREPMVITRSQRPLPRFSLDGNPAGQWRWALEFERHLQEASPVVWWLRGTYNELRYQLGVFASATVTVGREGWMFMSVALHPDERRLAAAAADRARFLARLRARTDELGVRLLVAVCPDKERIYPEHVYERGVMPPAKERLYPLILRELAEAGIEHVDLGQALAAARGAMADELYYRRDTHWRPVGALVAGRAIAARLESWPYAALLGPRLQVELLPPHSARVLPDIAAMAAFKSFDTELPGGVGTVPASRVTQQLAENKDYYRATLREGAGSRPIESAAEVATVLLAGTSFSVEGGAVALQFALQRPVRVKALEGADGTKALRLALRELATPGCKVKTLVWEFVERGYLEEPWLHPEAEPL